MKEIYEVSNDNFKTFTVQALSHRGIQILWKLKIFCRGIENGFIVIASEELDNI